MGMLRDFQSLNGMFLLLDPTVGSVSPGHPLFGSRLGGGRKIFRISIGKKPFIFHEVVVNFFFMSKSPP